MEGIKKICLTILSFVVVITVFTACGNSKDKEKVQNSMSKDLIKSNVLGIAAVNEENNLNTTTDASSTDSSNAEKSSKNKNETKKSRMVMVDGRTYMDTGYVR